LGGLVLLIDRYFQPRPAKKWDIQSLRNPNGDTKLVAPLPLMKEEDKLMEIVTIKRGQTISYLTEKYYGMVNFTLMDFILASNPDIKDVHLILVDQKIKIPKITNELLTTQSTDHAYKIQVGTFPNPDLVRFYSNEPALKGKGVEIFPRKVSPQETWYRMVVGPFGHKDECLKVIAQLKEKGLLPVFGGIFKME
jgi:phage tail protein X